KALHLIGIYDDSKTFIADEKVERVAADIKVILKKDAPYQDIPELPELLGRFTEAYRKVLDDMDAPVIVAIDAARNRVFEVLETKSYKGDFSDRFSELFDEIHEKAAHCNNVATLQNIKVEADALKVRLLNEMSKRDEQIAKDKIAEEKAHYGGGENPEQQPQPKIKKRKNISIKTINLSASWQIETAQDVDKYMAALRERILKELDEDTIINIEF
ncbi:MAG: BREX system P-loop protein BrxC, partial [Acetobacterium sp.]|nr:BREX system P-loop protein BrxC [Acetobacterium sp.]